MVATVLLIIYKKLKPLITQYRNHKYLPMTHRFFQLLKKSFLKINSDLKKISEWAHQWKMIFIPDPRKEATEVYFSRKLNQDSPLPLDFNDNTVQTVDVHNHLGLSLDKKS